MAPDTDRRSLRSLRSDRDDSKERGVAFHAFVSLRGHPAEATSAVSCRPMKGRFGEVMAPDTDRRSLRSLRSDRDDSKERGVAFHAFVSLRGHPAEATSGVSCRPMKGRFRRGHGSGRRPQIPPLAALGSG
jgi:hypothetical protein